MKKLTLLLILTMALLSVYPLALAQEPTAIPLPEVTAEPGGGLVETVTGLQEFGLNLWTVITGVVLAFAAGGVTGIGGAVVIINRIKDDKATMRAIEGLINSWPPESREVMMKIGDSLGVIGGFVKEVSDGVPTPPQEPQG